MTKEKTAMENTREAHKTNRLKEAKGQEFVEFQKKGEAFLQLIEAYLKLDYTEDTPKKLYKDLLAGSFTCLSMTDPKEAKDFLVERGKDLSILTARYIQKDLPNGLLDGGYEAKELGIVQGDATDYQLREYIRVTSTRRGTNKRLGEYIILIHSIVLEAFLDSDKATLVELEKELRLEAYAWALKKQ